MAAWSAWGQHVPQSGEAQDELTADDNHHAFSAARPSQDHPLQWQHSSYLNQFTFYGGDSAPAQSQPAQGASAGSIGYSSTSLQGASSRPSASLVSRSQYGGAGAAAADNLTASGNAGPDFLSTPQATQVEVACTHSISALFDPAYQAYQNPGYANNHSNPDPPQQFLHFYGNDYNDGANDSSLHFGNPHAQVTYPPPLPQIAQSEALRSDFYAFGTAPFQPSQRRHNELNLNQEGSLVIANRPLDGFAPANDNNLLPADVPLYQRLSERVTPSSPKPTRLAQLTPVSAVYDRAYHRPQLPARETEGLDQVEGLDRHSSNPRASTRDKNEHALNGNIQNENRQEQHIPGGNFPRDWNSGEWIAGTELLEDYANEDRRRHSSSSVFGQDYDLIMPSQPLASARESGASRKRPRPVSSLDAGAGPSRQKRRTPVTAVSVANRVAAKVCKASCQTPAAGWDQDDPFTIKDDEEKKIELVDMTADDNIPDELQILPDPPSTKLSKFECIICLDAASTLTVTHCGHMFCGACLYQALHAGATKMVCPMCRQKLEHRKWNAVHSKNAKTLFHLELKLAQTKSQGKQPVRPPRAR